MKRRRSDPLLLDGEAEAEDIAARHALETADEDERRRARRDTARYNFFPAGFLRMTRVAWSTFCFV
jgi:hypothetical protein